MRILANSFRALAFALALPLAAAGTTAASAGSAWDDVRGSVFGHRPIEDGRGSIQLTAPGRPDDMRAVPISVAARFTDGRTIKAVTFLIDENPTPVVAVFHMGDARDHVTLASVFRVDRQSDVRAVVETSDGHLYMVSQLIKYAGGQSSCSAPPAGDPAEILATMGRMAVQPVKTSDARSTIDFRARLDLSHPNHTGMVMDQQTLLYVPMKMVAEIDVRRGDTRVFTVEGSIALSQNPSFEFDLPRAGGSDLVVTMKDTDGATWTRSLPIGPAS